MSVEIVIKLLNNPKIFEKNMILEFQSILKLELINKIDGIKIINEL